jgi:hypothetical protein
MSTECIYDLRLEINCVDVLDETSVNETTQPHKKHGIIRVSNCVDFSDSVNC